MILNRKACNWSWTLLRQLPDDPISRPRFEPGTEYETGVL